ILEQSLKIPPIYARVNTLKTSTEELLKKIDGKETIKNCIAIDNIKEIDKMKEYKQGYFHIQDISSQLCIQMLNPKPNDTIIDMCSAPGSKAFTMAEYMQNQGKILAFDIHPHKIELIKQGAKRLGIDIIDALVQDGTLAQNIPLVDKVLCDVPCSGLGIIGRKPEIKYKDLSKELPQVQYKILCNGANYTKDILVYSTCTINKLENEDVVNLFLSNHPEFKLEQMITRIPHKDNCDGFFTAVMSKGGNRC
ncbi:MAG: SAM-dependent methyltransferase, partial [Oscillospiraceae bacterium]